VAARWAGRGRSAVPPARRRRAALAGCTRPPALARSAVARRV